MKKYSALIILIFTMLLTNSLFSNEKTNVWRDGEMEVRIFFENSSQYKFLKGLNYDGDVYPNETGLFYLIPSELQKLKNYGFNYKIEKKDLNHFSNNFWASQKDVPNGYYTTDEIIELADSLQNAFPNICKKYVYGNSIGGKELGALKITDNVDVDEIEAEVLFDGGTHGDEILGSEISIRFARDLCVNYGSDPEITDLVDNREIWIYYAVNPDGRDNMTRRNNNSVDLNRDWGYMWNGEGDSPAAFSQPELKVFRKLIDTKYFSTHATYHAGIEMVIFPWSYREVFSVDHDFLNSVSQIYSESSLYSNLVYGSCAITLYPVNGGSFDTNYGSYGTTSICVELSQDKQPPASEILDFYNKNRPSMLKLIEYAGYGLEGTVTDINTGEPIIATIFVDDYFQCYTDLTAGDYHKYVLPGTYSIKVIANGYENQIIDNIIVTENDVTVVDFELTPEENNNFIYKITECVIPDNNTSDEADTPAVFGQPDNRNYSIGKLGYIVLDMQNPIIDGIGNDIKVYEGDSSPEEFSILVSEFYDGPWTYIGDGIGTTEFDLGEVKITNVQFIKIVDDGDGSQNVADAGFDLDAIEVLSHESGVYLTMLEYTIDDSETGNDNGRIDAGETFNLVTNIVNNGDITAENIDGTISTNSQYLTINSSNINYGSLSIGETSEGVFNITAEENTPLAQLVDINLSITSDTGNYVNEFDLFFTVGLVVEDFEVGNFSSHDWVMGGNLDWVIDNSTFYEGEFSAKSGAINDNQTSEISITIDIQNANEISFYKKVSSEIGYDFLKFYIDNSEISSWSGEVDWSEEVYPVTSGEHNFKWVYTKDGTVLSGSDCAWIDNIILPFSYGNIINDDISLVNQVRLEQNYPNPFNPLTRINYELRITNYEKAEIVVYNSVGQQVWSSPITRHASRVTDFILFDGSKFNSGIYYYSLVLDGKKISTKAMVLIK